MKIGIIGSGEIGNVLARRLSGLGHQVALANSRGPASLAGLARETSVRPVEVAEAASAQDMVIVTIPMGKIATLPKGLFKPDGAEVIVDTGNYYPRERDGRIADIEAGMPESVWVSGQLGRPVIKAFNNIAAIRLLLATRKDNRPPGRIALPVAGDDPRHKATVMKLIEELGFDPFDSGSLADSWRQQPTTPVYVVDFPKERIGDALARASRERTPGFTGSADSPGDWETPR
ncbi:MAG: NAD(P)-binding domain-containing protein [Bauldia sp.]